MADKYGDLVMAEVNAPHQFSAENQIFVTRVERDYAEGELTIGENTRNPHGTVHGGALNTLADVVGGACACSRGNWVVTLSCSMEFLRPGKGEKIYCTARPKKMGDSVCVIAVELTDDEKRSVATGTFTYYVMEQRK